MRAGNPTQICNKFRSARRCTSSLLMGRREWLPLDGWQQCITVHFAISSRLESLPVDDDEEHTLILLVLINNERPAHRHRTVHLSPLISLGFLCIPRATPTCDRLVWQRATSHSFEKQQLLVQYELECFLSSLVVAVGPPDRVHHRQLPESPPSPP